MQLLAVYAISICVVILVVYILKSSSDRKKRLDALLQQCSGLANLHVFFECPLGHHNEAAEMIARLIDACDCPNNVQLHILEHVSSIKAIDLFTPALAKACSTQPRYATYFKDNIRILKVHQSRNLTGVHAILHLLQTLKDSLLPTDSVLWLPMFSTVQQSWDAGVIQEMSQHGDVTTLFSYPLCNEVPKDVTTFFSGDKTQAHFFIVEPHLEFGVVGMARPGVTASIGVSVRHCLGASVSSMLTLMEAACKYQIDDDLALSFLAKSMGLKMLHSAQLIACRDVKRRVPNRKSNLDSLHAAFQLYPDAVQWWLQDSALELSDDDLTLYGRAYLGMTADLSKQEILVKYGSEEAFETEKEALKYG